MHLDSLDALNCLSDVEIKITFLTPVEDVYIIEMVSEKGNKTCILYIFIKRV